MRESYIIEKFDSCANQWFLWDGEMKHVFLSGTLSEIKKFLNERREDGKENME